MNNTEDIVEISEQLSNKITAKYYNAGTKSAFVGIEERDDFVLMTPVEALKFLSWLEKHKSSLEMQCNGRLQQREGIFRL